ncbi:LuxR C-terminal-related transcriptional regulator [Streptomyces sp. BBFR51]|uniref:LuxR C-terminal-related transcriptional regulator n=1 Tax=Streptomyces sp. BBFR51 TaxID=3372856 RepID=UPI0037DC7A63
MTRGLKDADFLDVMGAGVRVVVRSHDVSPDRLARAVSAAAAGHGDLVDRLLALAVSVRRLAVGQDTAGSVHRPSPRELTVRRHVAEGLSNQEIAQRLECSEWAVKNSLRQVIGRWGGVRGREHAMAHAIRAGHI